MFAADLPVAEAPEADDGIVGEYGVAGPEALDALAADDAPTGEIDDWGSYRSEPEPRRRRRFGRRKATRAEEVIDDGFVGAATEPTASETPDASDSTFGRPAEAPAGVEAFDDWYEAEQRVEKAHQLAESRQWAEALAEIDAADARESARCVLKNGSAAKGAQVEDSAAETVGSGVGDVEQVR